MSVAREIPKSREWRQRRQDYREPRLSSYQRRTTRARSSRKPISVLMTAKLGNSAETLR